MDISAHAELHSIHLTRHQDGFLVPGVSGEQTQAALACRAELLEERHPIGGEHALLQAHLAAE